MTLCVTCHLWHDATRGGRGYDFSHHHVRILKAMVERNLSLPHRFVCCTDDIIPGIETIPLDWSKHVPGTVFLRLMQHNPEFGEKLGTRILSLDIDMVIVGSLDKLVSRTEDFIIWRNPNFPKPLRSYFQSSVQLFSPGSRPELYDDFDPKETPKWVNWRFGGREQAWIAERLEWGKTAIFTEADGIYGAGRLGGEGVYGEALPENACIVSFPGARAPWQEEIQQKHTWITDHYHA